MSAADNTALVRRIMEAFANKEGFALRDCFAEDAVWHVPGDGVMSGTYRGLQVRDSSRELGRLTTTAVVQSIFLVLLADAMFAVAFWLLDI